MKRLNSEKQLLETAGSTNINFPLQYRRYGGDMIEVFKFSHDFYETNKLLDFEKAPPHNIRGNPFKIIKQNCKKDVRKYYFKYRVIEQWNNLPLHIVIAPSLNVFKNRIDKLWGRDGVMYDSDVNLYETTSARSTRYAKDLVREA